MLTAAMFDSTLKQELQLIKDCVEATRVDSVLLKEQLETLIKDKIDDTHTNISEAIVERLETSVTSVEDEIQHLRNYIEQTIKNITEFTRNVEISLVFASCTLAHATSLDLSDQATILFCSKTFV
jgi:hypothetical protein